MTSKWRAATAVVGILLLASVACSPAADEPTAETPPVAETQPTGEAAPTTTPETEPMQTAAPAETEVVTEPDVARPAEMTDVTVAMGHEAIFPGEEAYMYAVPKQLGFFEEENLNVEFQPTAGSGAALQLVTAGQAHMGQGNPGAVLAGIAEGVPARIVYNIIPQYGSGLAVLADSDIESPEDMQGGTIGVASLASARLLEAQAMVEAAGLVPDEDVTFVAVGVGAQAASALQSGQVDGLYLWDAAYKGLELQGVELRVIKDVFAESERLLDFVHYVNTDFLEENPEAVAAFGRAVSKGIVWASENPEAGLELFYTQYPDVRPNDEEGQQNDLELFTFAVDQVAIEGTDQSGWGETPEANVQETIDFLVQYGVLEEPLPAEEVFTNEFVDDYNAFDEEEIRAQAAEA